MKKTMILYLLLCLIFSVTLSAIAEEALPVEIQKTLQQTTVTSSAYWEEAGNETWFVVTQTDEVNTLHCFMLKDGCWMESFNTVDAIPQDANRIGLYISESAWLSLNPEDEALQPLEGPILLIMKYGVDSGSVEQLISFHRSEMGTWNLITVNAYAEQTTIEIYGNEVIYYVPGDKAHTEIVGTIPCWFDRDIRFLRLPDVPLTFEQANP